MKIEGVPEGWELVRIGVMKHGEWTIDSNGGPQQYRGASFMVGYWPIIRRLEPVCTWQHGMFADGWIAEDANKSLWVYANRPFPEHEGWVSRHNDGWCMRLNRKSLINPPVFRSDLPWTKRIQQVGPTIEATLKVMT